MHGITSNNVCFVANVYCKLALRRNLQRKLLAYPAAHIAPGFTNERQAFELDLLTVVS